MSREQGRESGQPPRVAIVVAELAPGGMERVVVHLAKGLSLRGVPTLVVCLQNPGELASELDRTGVRFEALRSLSSRDLGAVWRLRSLLREFRPDVVNVHDYASTPYVVCANWLAQRVPIQFTAHGELYEGFAALRRRCRFFGRAFSLLSAVSEEIAECHREYLGWSGPGAVIRNGVPAVERDPLLRETVRLELGCGPDDVLFLAMGNPRSEKAFEDLIDATAVLRDTADAGRRFLVAVAGKMIDSDYCRMLTRRVTERGVGDLCRFLGYRSDTAALYSAADVFVLSSRSEGLPMVVLESMMAGLPVVATRVGGVPGAVEDRGLLVDAGNPAQLAGAMGRMLGEEGLAARLGRSGQAHATAVFGVDRMIEEYLGCYRGLLRRDAGA